MQLIISNGINLCTGVSNKNVHLLHTCNTAPQILLSVFPQQTFQRCFNVVVRLIWRHNVGQHQINAQTMLHTSTLDFRMLSNLGSTLSVSTLICTMLAKEETTLFLTSIYTTFSQAKTTLWIWPLKKMKTKLWVKNRIIFLKFNKKDLNWICWNLLHFVSLFMEQM